MNFPLKGDTKFLSNLKKGDTLFCCEAEWNPEHGHTEVFVKKIYFDKYDDKAVKSDDDEAIYAFLSSETGVVKTGSMNILYGFYETPLDALNSLRVLYSEGLDAVNKTIKQEKRRIAELEMIKEKKD